ncbi:hypothetical protein HN51_011232 [Arachis hypogaea]|uniref:DUF1421 domain-containing protein n=2 Tax=Arachis TaxID=3817 RepID=A0A445E028_ARAHY|nr:uncharacterized protein LOC107478128 [Arachis duranensis]XP_025687623.1 activating signal cointegrator 1 complex subunit 2 homolog [Arachis hypogaea]QHO56479.1 uncharacterized protein DS421_3g74070 [Arachis hypogaea]RYR68803.1 hypothetical protein Ahy_A03g015270 [Arachis hypogaea]
MASGSSGRGNSGSKGFDFGSDDILCSYEDFGNRDSNSSNGNHSDPVINANSTKDFHKSRMTRASMFPTTAYNPPEDSLSQDVIATVEKSMKKYADNLMRFLEGISSRLSQLELYCYNLDKSIGEMRSDLNRDHGEQDLKLKALEKHLQEVHRSVQILRDKQELADTQKELAKLQLAQKESSSSSHSEERSSPSTTDPKKIDSASDAHNQQLALALPHQIPPQQPPPQPAAPHAQAPVANASQATQQPTYYMQQPPTPLPNPPAAPQLSQNQYLPLTNQQYQTPQLQQDMSRVTPQPTPSQVAPSPAVQQFPQYQQPQQQQQQPQQPQPPQQQWAQQVPSSQPPSMPPQIRTPTSYPSYLPSQPANPTPPTETLPNSMPMQMPAYSGVPQPGSSRGDAMPYGYGGTAGRTVPQQQPPPQQMKGSFPAQPGDMYGTASPHPALPPPASAYTMYEGEGGRTHHPPQPPPHYAQAGYPPSSASLQNPGGHNLMGRNPNQTQFMRNHPYNELIEKMVSMGFRGDHVASVIQRMEDSGQPIDFNSVLDRLNVHGSVGPQRGGWSG